MLFLFNTVLSLFKPGIPSLRLVRSLAWYPSQVLPLRYGMQVFKKLVNRDLKGWKRTGSSSDVADDNKQR